MISVVFVADEVEAGVGPERFYELLMLEPVVYDKVTSLGAFDDTSAYSYLSVGRGGAARGIGVLPLSAEKVIGALSPEDIYV